jgi:hypothetical protein
MRGRLPLRARAWARSNAPSQSRMPFLPVGHHCGPGDFEPAMGRAVEGLAVEVGDGQHVCVGFADRARCRGLA